MPRLFVGNFHFEQELARSTHRRCSAALLRMSAERAPCWISLAENGDWIWTPEPISDGFWESLAQQGLPRVRGVVELDSVIADGCEIVFWGVSLPRPLGCTVTQPSESSVIQANSRKWSMSLEQELGVALPGASRIERVEDFTDIVNRSANEFHEPTTEHSWVVKANLGMAARERLLGRGTMLLPTQLNWLSRRLRQDGVVFFEPWLRRRAEVGIQWTLPPLGQGEPKLEGITPLICDSLGGYRGSEFSLSSSIPMEWTNAVETCELAARRLQTIGYFGPLGIDAAIYEDSAGMMHMRPLQDINARYTMGRLALGFRHLLRGEERGLWQHARVTELNPPAGNQVTRGIDLTPHMVGGRPPTHGSQLWISDRSTLPLSTSCSDLETSRLEQ